VTKSKAIFSVNLCRLIRQVISSSSSDPCRPLHRGLAEEKPQGHDWSTSCIRISGRPIVSFDSELCHHGGTLW
jgi:hypothetical protein